MGGHDPGEHGFLVHLDIVEGFQGQAEVTQQAVNSQKADDGEITQHTVQGSRAIFTSDLIGVFASFCGCELFVDLRTLDE
jgi:hypothetical protein